MLNKKKEGGERDENLHPLERSTHQERYILHIISVRTVERSEGAAERDDKILSLPKT
jgi:hypothetical protein